jgi:hypothetical protein
MSAAGRITRRVRNALRREAFDLLHGGPPTVDLVRPVGPNLPSDARVQQVLDLCMRVGEVLLSSGEAAEETTTTMIRLASACGLPTVDVDITFNSITMCCHRGMLAAPVTSMRLVRRRTTDLTRLAAVTRIVERVEQERLGAQAGAALLPRRSPHRTRTRAGCRRSAGPGWRGRWRCCSAGRRSPRSPRSWSPR